jgi:hypothetical protein
MVAATSWADIVLGLRDRGNIGPVQEQPHEVERERFARRRHARCPILVDADVGAGPTHSLRLPPQGGVHVGARPYDRSARFIASDRRITASVNCIQAFRFSRYRGSWYIMYQNIIL